jgi:hypothetical protein
MSWRTAVLACAALAAAGTAVAHGPQLFDDEPVDVDEPRLSWVFVGEFVTGDELVELRLDYADEGFALPIELLVPHQPALADHRPRYAVVGPGLPPPTDAERALLPREVPEGMGVFLEHNDGEPRVTLFEGFMRRMYWTSEPVALALDAGRSEIWVWSPRGTTGRFAIGLGVEEDFGPDSIVDVLANWSDFAY